MKLMKELSKDTIKEFYKILDDSSYNENNIQNFLENNSELIPLPFLNGHQLHFTTIISKFKLGNEYVTDFAYLTKCSDYWYFVLVELEDSKKKIFTRDKENIHFSADFNHAYDQITSWKAYINDNRESVLKKVNKIKIPLGENPIYFKYVLIIGRNEEKKDSERKTKMFAQKSNSDTKVMTYDSIISAYKYLPYIQTKLIVSPWKEQGFNVKIVPKNLSTNIFAYVSHEFLKIDEENIKKLKNQDYQMDAWFDGEPLVINEKYDKKIFVQRTKNPLIKAVCEMED
jgi:hypothetical protein